MIYNWQQKDWCSFHYDSSVVEDLLFAIAEETGHISGLIAGLPDKIKTETIIQIMVSEALNTSAIEGEYLSRQDVMSSIKNNLGINKQKENIKDKNGFTMLVAIIITSMLMMVSFVVVNIALKQLILTNAAKESQYSFYNADSGTECAVYWDIHRDNENDAFESMFASSPESPTAKEITCSNQKVIPSVRIDSGNYINNFTIVNHAPDGSLRGCFIVEVTKYANGVTEIDSRGYNTCDLSNPRRYERGVTLRY